MIGWCSESTTFAKPRTRLAVNVKTNDTDLIIGHHTSIPSTVEYKNHTIGLLEVNYDKKKNFGEEKHCSIKLRID